MQFLALFLGFAMLGIAITMGGPLASFINMPSVIIVIGGSILFTLAVHSGRQLTGALGAAFSHNPLARDEAERHAAVLQTLRITLKGSGWTGLVIGLVLMLQNMDDPSAIGPAMAVALLTVFYAQVLGELVVAPRIQGVLARAEAKTGS